MAASPAVDRRHLTSHDSTNYHAATTVPCRTQLLYSKGSVRSRGVRSAVGSVGSGVRWPRRCVVSCWCHDWRLLGDRRLTCLSLCVSDLRIRVGA